MSVDKVILKVLIGVSRPKGKASVWHQQKHLAMRLTPLTEVVVIVMWPRGSVQGQSAAGLPKVHCHPSLTLEF